MGEITEKWTMHRAVLFNYWYYPNQELLFSNGCAVLRGHNGSGKSVTTQSLITVLLDGDVRSHKLDPFGGRERKITDTVLGEKGLVDIDHRIGYIALEFKRGNTNIFKTIGMGVEADRNKKQPNVWYFIIDGKRIGEKERDLKLYEEVMDEGKVKKLPRNEKELRNVIEAKLQCGKVYSNRDEYADNVNKHLFGFESLESFKGLIDLLLQARSPKLSDQNKPEGVVQVLNDSLPQLTGEELRPLTSSIEAIDRIEKDLRDYRQDLKGINALHEVYEEYNKITLAEKAVSYLKSTADYEETKKKITESKKNIEKFEKRLAVLSFESKKLDDELSIFRTEKANLGLDEIEALQQNKNDEEKNLVENKNKLAGLEEKKETAEKEYRTYKLQYEEKESQKKTLDWNMKGYLSELKNLSADIHFEEHDRFYNHFFQEKDGNSYSFATWKDVFDGYKQFIKITKEKLDAYEGMKKEVEVLDNQLGNIRMEIDKSQSIIDKEEENHETEVIKLTHEIGAWSQSSKTLSVSEDIVDGLQRNLEDVFDSMEKEVYFSILKLHYEGSKKEHERQLMKKGYAIELLASEIEDIESKIQDWKGREEIEPEFAKKRKSDWEKLYQNGIEFRPFYEVFEYKEGISEIDKINIQSALLEAGILSSVVVPKNSTQIASEYSSVLMYGPKKEVNLGEVLIAAGGFEQYNEILDGISFEKNTDGYVLSDGSYHNAFVEGKSSVFEDNIYIGKASREAVRRKKIEELEQIYLEKVFEKEKVEKEISDIEMADRNLDNEYQAFPSLENLEVIIKDIKNEVNRIKEVLEPEEKSVSSQITGKSSEMKLMMTEIKKQMNFTELSLTLDSFVVELKNLDDYSDCLSDLESSYKERNSIGEVASTKLNLVNAKEEEANYYHSEIKDIEGKISTFEKKIENFDKRLRDIDSDNILERVNELTYQINTAIPEKKENIFREEEQVKNKKQGAEEYIRINESNKLPFQLKIQESWEGAFGEHVKLGFITIENGLALLDLAQFIKKEYGQLIDKKRENVEKIKNRLDKVYKDQSVVLPMHYDPDMKPVKSDYFPTIEGEGEDQVLLNLMSEQMTRLVVTLEVDNHRVSPSGAVKLLKDKIEDLEVNAAEKDRELYQEILINTLGESIRRKINYVEQWEKEMNKFMEHENLIKFRIKWVPKTVEEDKRDEELNTQQLVKALKKDSRWIDIDQIGKHFRSKIKEAKRKVENDNEVNLQKVMREVLDYRTWFDFEIYFTKKGDKERRLNRNSYGELSGGQRVLAMVTPVLAALYAKYLEGREDAPKIFTLDEAFSRVDEENINVMFNYIYKLGFNYILNSQSLWGCFESVPSLSIYELSRPENRPSVTVLSYFWNGNRRKRVEENELKELIEGNEVDGYVSTT